MRILPDECVPWPMHKLLAGHDFVSTQWRDWGGIKNGELVRLAETQFDILVTCDQSLRYQQNLAGRSIAILGAEVVAAYVTPLQGLGDDHHDVTQGVALGCRISPRLGGFGAIEPAFVRSETQRLTSEAP